MLNLHFPNYPGANSKLPPGGSFSVRYGTAAEEHVGPVNAYLASPSLDTGTLSLKNTTAKPADVSEAYVKVHLTSNGQNVSDIELPWNSTKIIGPLASGAYMISADNVKGGNGSVYEATVNPSSVNIKADQVVTSNIQYKALQQVGSVGISLRALPAQLSGYDGKPTVVLTESTGSSSSAKLEWNALTTVGQLKNGSSYKLSTGAISYNNFQCQPTFKPASLVASATAPKSTLSYACTSTAQNRMTLKVQGAPASLSQLKVTLTPNNNTVPTTQVVPLAGGNGSSDLQLPNGVTYTVSTEAVSGYTVNFSQQPLISSVNAVETITFTSTANGTPVSINGQLKVCGTKLCNKNGVPFQLKGLSTHGLQWYGWNKCITPSSLDALAKDFKANVIRVSLYVQEGGYETNPTGFTQQMNQIITEASARGMYVIVDWHMLNPGDPNYSLELAKTFFTSITNSHKNRENILYEIANEPSGVSWSAIKSYAEKIIPIIREIDANAPILVGTRAWSSLGVSEGGNSSEMISNPVNASNIMYTFHFYAASHKDAYLNELDKASSSLPIFVTEFGTQTHTGDGGDDFIMSEKYLKLMADKKMGWTSWNYSDDARSGAVWKAGTCSKGAWVDGSLKPAGVWIKNKIKN
jgi:endoglucanase